MLLVGHVFVLRWFSNYDPLMVVFLIGFTARAKASYLKQRGDNIMDPDGSSYRQNQIGNHRMLVRVYNFNLLAIDAG